LPQIAPLFTPRATPRPLPVAESWRPYLTRPFFVGKAAALCNPMGIRNPQPC
jgi:hypothetical protein